MFRIDPKRLDLAAEFRANPVGIHSPELQAVLTVMRSLPLEQRYVLIRRKPWGDWALGQLTGGVAHDFNNLLSIIQGYSVSLQEEKWLPPDASEALNQIYSAAQRAAHLTRQLLTFSRRSTLHIQTLDLNDAIGNVSKLLRRVLGENIELKLDLSAALPAVEADVGMMEQVVMNLALNAQAAMDDGGTLTIRTWVEGNEIVAEFTDTGCGIPPDKIDNIFDPFYSTKLNGTGLGLFVSYGIIQNHHGTIEVESQVNTGSRFTVRLPVQEAS